MEQKLTNLQAIVTKLHHDNSVLMANQMTVTFNKKGVLVNNSEGEIVIRGHLDLDNNLYMVPADDTHATTVQYEALITTRNIVKLSQHR